MSNEPDAWMPKAWPLFWRRTFLLTLPISGPLWCAIVVACGIFYMVMALVLGPFMMLWMLKESLWDAKPHERRRGWRNG